MQSFVAHLEKYSISGERIEVIAPNEPLDGKGSMNECLSVMYLLVAGQPCGKSKKRIYGDWEVKEIAEANPDDRPLQST